MDYWDRILLNHIQEGLPLTSSPFLSLASELNLSEDEVLKRIKRLQSDGYIRRIGGVFDSGKLGYVGVLCCLKVRAEQLEDVKKCINRYTEVTHNYLRNHEYNVWFTLTTVSKERQEHILHEIQNETNAELIKFPAIKKYKIKAYFDMKEDAGHD